MKPPYTVIYTFDPDTLTWFVEVEEIPGCHSQGATKEEAYKRIQEAIQLYNSFYASDRPLSGECITE